MKRESTWLRRSRIPAPPRLGHLETLELRLGRHKPPNCHPPPLRHGSATNVLFNGRAAALIGSRCSLGAGMLVESPAQLGEEARRATQRCVASPAYAVPIAPPRGTVLTQMQRKIRGNSAPPRLSSRLPRSRTAASPVASLEACFPAAKWYGEARGRPRPRPPKMAQTQPPASLATQLAQGQAAARPLPLRAKWSAPPPHSVQPARQATPPSKAPIYARETPADQALAEDEEPPATTVPATASRGVIEKPRERMSRWEPAFRR